jgi:hypothetical protein
MEPASSARSVAGSSRARFRSSVTSLLIEAIKLSKLQNAWVHRELWTSLRRFVITLRFDQTRELAGVIGEAGEDCAQVAVAQVFVDDFA